MLTCGVKSTDPVLIPNTSKTVKTSRLAATNVLEVRNDEAKGLSCERTSDHEPTKFPMVRDNLFDSALALVILQPTAVSDNHIVDSDDVAPERDSKV